MHTCIYSKVTLQMDTYYLQESNYILRGERVGNGIRKKNRDLKFYLF